LSHDETTGFCVSIIISVIAGTHRLRFLLAQGKLVSGDWYLDNTTNHQSPVTFIFWQASLVHTFADYRVKF